MEDGWKMVGRWLEDGWKMVGRWLEDGWKMVAMVSLPEVCNVEDNPLVHVNILHRKVEPEPKNQKHGLTS